METRARFATAMVLIAGVALSACGARPPCPALSAVEVYRVDLAEQSEDYKGFFEQCIQHFEACAQESDLTANEQAGLLFCEASLAYDKHDFELARSLVDQGLESHADEVLIHHLATHVCTAENDPEGAVESAEQEISLAPEWKWSWLDLYMAYMSAEELEMAEEALLHFIEMEPESAMAYSMLGALRMQLGYSSEIWLAHLVKSTELEPENPAWLMDLYDILTQVASIFPDKPFTQQDLLDETESRILEIFPGEPAVLMEMARRRWSLHDYDRAWELSISAAQMAPGNLATAGGLVLVCEKKGNCTEAIDYILALDLGAGDEALEITTMLVDALQKQDALGEAEDLANRVLEKNPGISSMHLLLSDIMSKTCRLEEALTHAEKAIEIDPQDDFARAIHATVLTDLDRMAEAMQIAEALVENSPDSYLSWAIRSMVFYEMGDFDKALSDIEKASEINPDSLFVSLAHSDTLFFLGRIEEAVDVADMACAGIKDEAACWSITGTLEAAQGEAADGVLLLEKAQEMEPGNTHNEIYLAYALGELEKTDSSVKGRAEEVFMKAVTAKPALATKPWVLQIKAGIPGMKKATLEMGPLSTCP